jgi:tRNA 2-thiouridine synthesizing protein A
VLEVLTDNPPSCENVPRAVKEDGHDVLSVEKVDRGVWRITVVRKR